ncbi:V-type ATPase subunit, partial [Longicatena caecimuris]
MAAGVIAAKARSMLGEQLSAQDYEELLHKRSVAEIAAYLKNGTSYAHALKDV